MYSNPSASSGPSQPEWRLTPPPPPPTTTTPAAENTTAPASPVPPPPPPHPVYNPNTLGPMSGAPAAWGVRYNQQQQHASPPPPPLPVSIRI